MNHEILYPGLNAILRVRLGAHESVQAESGTMVAKSDGVTIQGEITGGWKRALRRKFLGREPLFFQSFKAGADGGEVLIAPGAPGDIQMLSLEAGQDYFLQGGAFLASAGDVVVDTCMQRFSQGMFSGEGAFVLHATGLGAIAVSAFGAVYEVPLPVNKKFSVGASHLVAWSGDTTYAIRKAAEGWLSSFMSGETFVCDFEGPGTVFLQTRSPEAFGSWIRAFVPRRG